MSENASDLKGKVLQVDIEQEMRSSFIEYAMSVIVDRALPDVRDGLKPVHRRILYSMYEQGFTPDKAYRKSAKIVGDVMGKYHPHGDAAIYDSLVRLAQDFSMRYVLIDGKGNFGSRDGDPPAAQRYTEARLEKISMEMLSEINKNTVDFRPNYDEHEVEPTVLPARFPNLLVNGSHGIAVGMATNIPPHNLGEVIDGIVHVIDNPDTTIDELMQFIKGPDFPTGANILGVQGIRQTYRTGRGRIIVRAEATIEEMKNGRQAIIVTELPYMVNNARLVERIAELIKDKRIDGISDLRDEYGKEGIRIVIELKREANANIVLNQLYKYTSMQESFNANMLAIVPIRGQNDKYEPKVLNLREAIDYYIEHQVDVVRRRTEYDLEKALDRAHILEGTLLALDHIDEVINIIRSSRTEQIAKEGLMARFDFTERQAQYIVDLRLGRLTGLEREKILAEYEEKKKEIARYREILSSEYNILQVVKEELLVIKNKFADERRTKIVPYEGEIDIEDLIHEQEVAITLTHFGYVKRTSADTYKAQKRGGKGIAGLSTRENDFVKHLIITSSHNILLFFTNFGKVYSLKGYEIPDAGRTAKGLPIVNLLQLDPEERVETVIPITDFDEGSYLVMATRKGLVKKTKLAEYKNIRKSGLIAIALREEDELIGASLVNEGEDTVLVTSRGMCIRFNQDNVRATGRASMGVKGITLRKGDRVIGMEVTSSESNGTLLVISDRGFGKRTEISEYKTQMRGGLGIITYKPTKATGLLTGMMIVDDEDDIMLITSEGTIIRIHVSEISILGRATKGVRLMRTNDNNLIVGCAKTERDDQEEVGQVEELSEEDENDEELLVDENEDEFEEVEEDVEEDFEDSSEDKSIDNNLQKLLDDMDKLEPDNEE
ncbi:MAG TPA: DNA gyrase subunit A [Clostridiaceae bacterium]|jgi:DNA gyrase subunit A|nr:DNA gyrase subunit A [Clostridiaceae bacterium]HOA32041.1 DNA gyrase subunit A [Clostridia bacterium]